MPLPPEPHTNGNDHAMNTTAPNTVRSNDTKKQSEIKKKFEESLRQVKLHYVPYCTFLCFVLDSACVLTNALLFLQLHALQAEQTLLIQKRSEAQEQLQEAQRARVSTSTISCP